ncbi:hypothetical protein FI667_g4788, partial [Globisporangium splendens]
MQVFYQDTYCIHFPFPQQPCTFKTKRQQAPHDHARIKSCRARLSVNQTPMRRRVSRLPLALLLSACGSAPPAQASQEASAAGNLSASSRCFGFIATENFFFTTSHCAASPPSATQLVVISRDQSPVVLPIATFVETGDEFGMYEGSSVLLGLEPRQEVNLSATSYVSTVEARSFIERYVIRDSCMFGCIPDKSVKTVARYPFAYLPSSSNASTESVAAAHIGSNYMVANADWTQDTTALKRAIFGNDKIRIQAVV